LESICFGHTVQKLFFVGDLKRF